MIQRIQTLYLFLAVIVAGGLPFVFNLWKTSSETLVYAFDEPMLLGGFVLSGVLSLISIFLFKNRKLQFVINRLTIILNFILLIALVYRSLNLPGDAEVSEKGIGIFLPIISIVMIVLANKAIKKDEDLVKSVDRLR